MLHLRTNGFPVAVAVCCLFFCSCDYQSASNAAATEIPVAPRLAAPTPQVDEGAAVQAEAGVLEKMSSLVKKAKSKAPSVEDVKKMLSDAGEATSQTADDSMEWVEEAYHALSDQGLTSAKSASDWLKNDWNSMNTWEYQVLSVSGEAISTTPNVLEAKLNQAGARRWECFSVSESDSGITLFMKRQKKSYLKNVPLKDMMKLVPLLDGED